MVGAYPKGCGWDMCYGKEGEGKEDKWESVKRVEWLERDPVYGDDGPVLWSEEKIRGHRQKVAAKEVEEKGEIVRPLSSSRH